MCCVLAQDVLSYGSMVRGNVIFALCLSLAALAPLPLSACAMLAALPAECALSNAQSHCEQMGMTATAARLEAQPNLSCCRVTPAPLPEVQNKASVPDAGTSPVRADVLVYGPIFPADLAATDLSPRISPPDLQALLCVFLI